MPMTAPNTIARGDIMGITTTYPKSMQFSFTQIYKKEKTCDYRHGIMAESETGRAEGMKDMGNGELTFPSLHKSFYM